MALKPFKLRNGTSNITPNMELLQEAYHVFIEHGLRLFASEKINVLEIGFGTGLNAIITLLESKKLDLKVDYVGVEAYPVSISEVEALDYCSHMDLPNCRELLELMHSSPWEVDVDLGSGFKMKKEKKDFREIDHENLFNLVYFDAFGARVQPDLWTEEVFEIMYRAMKENGVLVTYAAKGSVRRALQAVGFTVERLPGPPGQT